MANDKNNTLRGLMKDKRIYSVLKDAVDSPIGSTSRKRAASMVSVLKKTNLASSGYGPYDGQGGPGVTQTQPTAPQTTDDYSSFKVLPAAPEMSGAGSTDWTKEISQPYQHGAIVKGAAAVQEGVTSAGQWLGGVAAPAALKTVMTPGAVALGTAEYGAKGAVRNIGMLRDWAFGSKPGEEWSKAMPSTDFSKTYGGEQLGAMWGGSLDKLRQASIAKGEQVGLTQKGPETPAGTQATGSGKQAETTTTTTGAKTTGAATGATTPTGPGQVPTGSRMLDKAVAGGMGPSMFALRAMSDPQGFKKLMKDVAGVDIADEDLPTGGSLSANIDKMEKALKLHYNLDDLLNQKSSIVETGVTVERDLKDYIRGRDEYLTETQRMIEDTQKGMWQQNLGDPQVAKQMDNYMNYLYTLRGNQNKRYIDFLNSGITQYNRDLTEVSNNYDKALAAYQHDLTTKSAITTEEFQMYNTALQEMYTNAEQAPMKKLQLQALYNQVHPAATGIVTDAAGNVINGGPLAKDLGILHGIPEGNNPVTTVKVGDREVPTISPYFTSIQDTMNDFTANGGVSTASVMKYITGGMKGSLEIAKDFNESKTLGKKFMEAIKDKFDLAADGQTQQEALDLAGEIAPALSKSISSTIQKDPATLGNMASATKKIVNKKMFGMGKVPTKQEVINSNPQVDPEVLNALYSMISFYKKANGASEASSNDILVLTANRGQQKISDLTPEEIADFAGDAISANMYRAVLPQ